MASTEPIPAAQKRLAGADWERLLWLAHTDRAQVFREYADYYLSTNGQRYWSDTHQLSTYLPDYHTRLDLKLGASHRGSEMISELYVPRSALVRFMAAAATRLRETGVTVIYGTVRFIERDTETVLAWAREPWACVIFNLHVDHSSAGIAQARIAFRGLIDVALTHGGSYFLTYHRWARQEQVEKSHPRMREFLAAKQKWDPAERFTSDWYQFYRDMFASSPPSVTP